MYYTCYKGYCVLTSLKRYDSGKRIVAISIKLSIQFVKIITKRKKKERKKEKKKVVVIVLEKTI